MNWEPNVEGAFLALPAATYHKAPGVSHSMLRHFRPTPAHLQAYLQEPHEPSAAMILGTLVHQMVLEPERPLPQIALKTDEINLRTKEGKAWKAEQEAAGRLILGTDAHDSLIGMVRSVSRHPRARELLSDGTSEVSLFGNITLGDTLLRKARLDFIPEANVLADIKTLDDASPSAFAKKLYEDGYATQAAYYLDLWNDLNPDTPREGFVFLAVERRKPYLTATYLVHPDAIAWGRKQNHDTLARYLGCVRENQWPGYPEQFVPLNLPDWAIRREAA